MPKQIPELKTRILREARTILLTEGYRALSMRALAQRCDVAPGTLYNYYSSKDALVAGIMLEDWQKCMAQMDAFAAQPHSLEQGLRGLCALLETFTACYQGVWAQYGGSSRAAGYAARYHHTLREQLAAPLGRVLRGAGQAKLEPLSSVLAETMLACAINDDLGAEEFGLLARSWAPEEAR